MPAQYVYTHAIGSNVDLSAQVRAYRTEATSNAEEGSVAISRFYVDDDQGGLDIKGLRQFDWTETSEGSNSRVIYHGYTADRTITRGPFRVLDDKQWEVATVDQNSLLTRRIMRGSDANRPAETDVARIQWLMATNEMSGLITDSTYINTSGSVSMDAADYRNQRVIDIVDDCAQASGKNYFIIVNELYNPYRHSLFYDFAGSTAYASTIRLSNVLSDVDSSTTFAVLNDETKLVRDPSRVYDGVVVAYAGGDVYVTQPSIGSQFHDRDTLSPSWNVKTAAKAQARGIRYLQENATEEDRITTAFLVPLAKVNRLKEGMTFQARFSHFPGYEPWTWLRVLNRTVLAISEEFYKITLECSPTATTVNSCSTALSGLSMYDSGIIAGGPPCTVSPPTPSSNPALTLTFMVMMQDSTCIGPPIVSTGLTISGFSDVQKWAGEFPGSCDHSLLAVGSKATTGGSPGSMTCTFTGNGAQAYRAIGLTIPTASTSAVQVAQQNQGGSHITLSSAPTPGNLLVMFRSVETNDWTGPPTGWTQIGSSVTINPGGISEHHMDVWCRCAATGDGTTFANGDASFTHWSFISEWALT